MDHLWGNLEEVTTSFYLTRLTFRIRPLQEMRLPPYKGSAFRGLFGRAFRQISCVDKRKACRSCLHLEQCPYAYVFLTPVPTNTTRMRKYPYAPHPFVLFADKEKVTRYTPDMAIEVEVTLIGNGVKFFPHFILAFQWMGQFGLGKARYRFLLEEVEDPFGRKLYLHGKLLSAPQAIAWADMKYSGHPSTIILNFITPLRIKYKEKYASDLEFHILIRSLLRRISLLSFFHCACELKLDFRSIIDLAHSVKTLNKSLKWYDWTRWSNRQRTLMKMGGLLGSVEFEGDLGIFWPFLALGEWIHVGKGTAFGLGKYSIMHPPKT